MIQTHHRVGHLCYSNRPLKKTRVTCRDASECLKNRYLSSRRGRFLFLKTCWFATSRLPNGMIWRTRLCWGRRRLGVWVGVELHGFEDTHAVGTEQVQSSQRHGRVSPMRISRCVGHGIGHTVRWWVFLPLSHTHRLKSWRSHCTISSLRCICFHHSRHISKRPVDHDVRWYSMFLLLQECLIFL